MAGFPRFADWAQERRILPVLEASFLGSVCVGPYARQAEGVSILDYYFDQPGAIPGAVACKSRWESVGIPHVMFSVFVGLGEME